MQTVLCRCRFEGKIGLPGLGMAPCRVEASAYPGLQALTGQALLQVGKVAQKVQHSTRTHRGDLLAPCQGLEPFGHRDERQRTADEPYKSPGVCSHRGEQEAQGGFDLRQACSSELVD